MSVFLAISQGARLAAVWTSNKLVTRLLLTASIVAYSVLLAERNKKINKYYERDKINIKPEDRNDKNKKVS